MPRQAKRGAVLLAVLVLLSVVALASSHLAQADASQQQRRNEDELLFVGEQYRQAIESYLQRSPNGIRQFPVSLEDLLNDRRFAQPQHHLRKAFRDPMAPEQPWGLIKVGDAIVGVHSQATAVPFHKTGFSPRQAGFGEAKTCADWAFKVDLRVPSLRP